MSTKQDHKQLIADAMNQIDAVMDALMTYGEIDREELAMALATAGRKLELAEESD